MCKKFALMRFYQTNEGFGFVACRNFGGSPYEKFFSVLVAVLVGGLFFPDQDAARLEGQAPGIPRRAEESGICGFATFYQ